MDRERDHRTVNWLFKSMILPLLRPFLAAAFGLAFGVLLTVFAGENPINVIEIMARGAFGSLYNLGMTMFYATPLMLTGLSVALTMQCGLVNIGAEGQLTMGALLATSVGLAFPGLPSYMAIPLVITAAFVGGAFWGAIPGCLKAWRGSHEVMTTIMLNFVAAGIAGYVVLNVIRTESSQNPESALLSSAYQLLPYSLFDGAPVTGALILAVALSVMVAILLRHSVVGYRLRVVGANTDAAQTAAIPVERYQIFSFIIAGGIAGLVAVPEVLGHTQRYRLGFSPDYGFIGIPVALLARSHPIGLLFSALLFGALQKATLDLEIDSNYVTRDLAVIIEAIVVLAVSADGGLQLWQKRFRRASKLKGSGDVST